VIEGWFDAWIKSWRSRIRLNERKQAIGVLLIVLVIGATIPVSHGRQPAACSDPLREVMHTSEVYSFDALEVISRVDAWTTGESEVTYLSHWDGTSWTRVAAPESRRRYFLRALSAAAPDDVWAVGFRSAGRTCAAALRWDGSAWNKIALPEVGRESWLSDVAALPGGEVVAVGGFRPRRRNGQRALILRFDGSQWMRERPSFGRGRYELGDIAGSAPEHLWVIPLGRGWVMHRLAGVWVKELLPKELRARAEPLEDVDVTPSGTAWFVGSIDRRGSKALVLEHGPTGWEEHPTPDRRYPEHLGPWTFPARIRCWVPDTGSTVTTRTRTPCG
jgi:hypothetical protein